MSSIRGLGFRTEFRVTKVILLFVRKVSLDGRKEGEGRRGVRGREGGENRWKRGGNRANERVARVAKERKSGGNGLF